MTMADTTSTRTFDASIPIRLLDHQIVDGDGRLIGKVDDLALREDGDELVVEWLMVGPAALAPRHPGALGRWGWAIWRRLNDPDDPGVVMIPLSQIKEISSEVLVGDAARDALLASFGLESWLRRNLIGRIPGAKGADPVLAEDTAPPWAREERPEVPERGRAGGTHRLTELLAMAVHGHDSSSRGCITDLHGQGTSDGSGIRITKVLVGPRLAGSTLGYSSDEQNGPRAISWVIDRLHRSAHWHDWSDLRSVSWEERSVEMDPHDEARLGRPAAG